MSKSQHQFLKVDLDYLRIAKVTNKCTGHSIRWGLPLAALWVLMHARYSFFAKRGQSYFDNQADIAEILGVHPDSVKRGVASMISVDLLVKHRKKLRGSVFSNSYVVKSLRDNPALVVLDKYGKNVFSRDVSSQPSLLADMYEEEEEPPF